jgi:hypothetical protein
MYTLASTLIDIPSGVTDAPRTKVADLVPKIDGWYFGTTRRRAREELLARRFPATGGMLDAGTLALKQFYLAVAYYVKTTAGYRPGDLIPIAPSPLLDVFYDAHYLQAGDFQAFCLAVFGTSGFHNEGVIDVSTLLNETGKIWRKLFSHTPAGFEVGVDPCRSLVCWHSLGQPTILAAA